MRHTKVDAHYLRSAHIMTGTYHPPRGKHLERASADEFVSFLIAYICLWLARREADDRHLAPQENAVSVSYLHSQGVRNYILQWMWYQAHVDHCLLAGSYAYSGDNPQENLVFTRQSAFWLTERGDGFAESFIHDALAPDQDGVFEAAWSRLLLGQFLPRYDREYRVLHWGAHLLKCFHQPAENQELILLAEEELNWPIWMDDPLPRVTGKNPKVRFHDTIKDLNRHHHESGLVHFRGDGSGTRIGWQIPEYVGQALSGRRPR